MNELNETPPRPIVSVDWESFTIEDTTKFQEYVNGGIVEEVKVPKIAVFKSLNEILFLIHFCFNMYVNNQINI